MTIKECPFCGGSALILDAQPDGYHWEFIVACASCKVGTEPYGTPDEAVRVWNNRITYTTDEWCTDCKEYDSEHHCCSRFNRVIRNTIDELKEAFSIVQCHECKHRPIEDDDGITAPKTQEDEEDTTCPYLSGGYMPPLGFYCAEGEK